MSEKTDDVRWSIVAKLMSKVGQVPPLRRALKAVGSPLGQLILGLEMNVLLEKSEVARVPGVQLRIRVGGTLFSPNPAGGAIVGLKTNILSIEVQRQNSRRVIAASDLIEQLIARAHAPEPGDVEATLAAVDVLAREGGYSSEQFSHDCLAVLEMRELLAEATASLVKRNKLLEEFAQIKLEISKSSHQPMPFCSSPMDMRLCEVRSRINTLDAQHAAHALKYDELAGTSERLAGAMQRCGMKAMLERWAPSHCRQTSVAGRPRF